MLIESYVYYTSESSDQLDFYGASNVCENSGAQLASITSQQTLDILQANLSQ